MPFNLSKYSRWINANEKFLDEAWRRILRPRKMRGDLTSRPSKLTIGRKRICLQALIDLTNRNFGYINHTVPQFPLTKPKQTTQNLSNI